MVLLSFTSVFSITVRAPLSIGKGSIKQIIAMDNEYKWTVAKCWDATSRSPRSLQGHHRVARLLYAAQAWWGFALAADRQRIERFILRTVRMGYLPQINQMLSLWLLTRKTVC